MLDAYDLQRFIMAQDRTYESVLNELRSGQKRSHWMWYIFSQINGLGASATAQKYAISSHDEARAYADHPVLGPRLRECTQIVINTEGRSAEEIFHYPDNLKFHSRMTLFEQSARDPDIFREALFKCFGGKLDQLTLDILRRTIDQS
jgi:uncharacterized protein (DUF1810 family)